MLKALIKIGEVSLPLIFHPDLAPKTCAAICASLPFENQIVHGRWSGEACWIPLGDLELGVPLENQTQEPMPGQLLFHPKGISEAEILVPYGLTRFASKYGPLTGSHFATIDCPEADLFLIGEKILLGGRQRFSIHTIPGMGADSNSE